MLFLLLLAYAEALYVPLTTPEGSPFLTIEAKATDWNTGLANALLETSLGVRVGPRGMHFYNHTLDTENTIPCARAQSALCRMQDGSLVLPTASPRYGTGTHECDGWGRTLVTANVYDISMCDIMSGTTLVWVPDNGGLLRLQHELGMGYWYIVTAIIVLFLVVSLGQNVARITGDEAAITYPVATEVMCLAQCTILLFQHNPFHVFLTHQDRLLLVVFNVYVLLYLVRHLFELVLEAHVFTLNVITATLVLVTARLYGSFETPYAPLFTFLLLTRLWHKIIHNRGSTEKLTIAMDVVVTALYWRLAYRPSFWDDRVADIYGVAMLFLCYYIGLVTQPCPCDVPQPQRAAQLTYHANLLTDRANGCDIGYDPPRLNLLHRCVVQTHQHLSVGSAHS